MSLSQFDTVNTIVNNFYNREDQIKQKVADGSNEEEISHFCKNLNTTVLEENKQLWSCFQSFLKNLETLDGWKYKHEFMLAYNNHKDKCQFYQSENGWTYEQSFVTDFIVHVMNITTPSRDFNTEYLNVLHNISYILDVKYKRGQVSNTENWVKDLWEHFTYIINSNDRDTILNLWRHGDAFRFTLDKHSERNQYYSATDGWSYEYSFMATLYLKIFHQLDTVANTEKSVVTSSSDNTTESVADDSTLHLMLNTGTKNTVVLNPKK